jgi:sugar O-acyltransferase (sialic acid O-acetyltransferase NeuD family)
MGGDVYVVGTRTFAAEVVDYARDAGLQVAGLVEPHDGAATGASVHGLPVTRLGDEPAGERRTAILGTGETDRRQLVERLRAAGWELSGLIHPRAHVAPSGTVEAGAVIGPAVVVGACAQVGAHAVLGRGALVGHHTTIGAFCTLGPGANVAGNVQVEDGALIAMGAVVRDHTTIGAGAVVAMGAVVVDDVPPAVEVRGIPARQAR